MYTIYEVQISKYYYLGSTKNPRKRKTDHLRLLKNNTHYNKFMQNVYNKHIDYNFTILDRCKDQNEMENLEVDKIKEYKEKYGKHCMNILDIYGGGSAWRKYKTEEELKIHDYNRTRITPEKLKLRNKKHSDTVKNIPIDIRRDWYDRANITRSKNIKTRKNYTPINLKISYPSGNIEFKVYDTESMFFEDTKLEDSALRVIKNNGVKIIKKRLHWTRHNYPVGTIIEKIKNLL
jgi:hypothetical protein